MFYLHLLAVFIGAINSKSVTLSGNVSVIFTLAKVSALAVIIVGGLVYLSKGTIYKALLNFDITCLCL